MHRYISYLLLFLLTALLQLFLFDNLTISVYINPLVYIAFIALLPMELKPVAVLLLGLVTGVAMDFMMGAAGINTIATLPVAFLRGSVLGVLYLREDDREAGVPSPERLGMRKFIEYIVVLVVMHHTLFFLLEALSWSQLPHTLLRIFLSSTLSAGFIWLIARIFTAKIPVRV